MMGADSYIEWCDDTLNVWTGCTKVDALCKHCYAEVSTPVRMARAGIIAREAREATDDEPAVKARLAVAPLELWGPNAARRETKSWEANLRAYARKAVREGKRRRVFAQSLSDTFEDRADLDPLRARFFAAIERLTWMEGSPLIIGESPLDLLLLTKRPENILRMVPAHWLTAWPSYVWIGTSVGTQAGADERIPHLLRVPAAVRFLSVEPQLEAVDLCRTGAMSIGSAKPCGCGSPRPARECHERTWSEIQWVIQGGESGPRARPFDLAWARSMRDQCKAAGVAYFFKQAGKEPVGNWYAGSTTTIPPKHGWRLADSHGGDESEWPEDLRGCRGFPEVKRWASTT